MQDIIDSTFRDCTVLAVTHQLSQVTKYDQVALMDAGCLVEFGRTEELITGSMKFAELCRTFNQQG